MGLWYTQEHISLARISRGSITPKLHAGLTQLGECDSYKVEVRGPIPLSCTEEVFGSRVPPQRQVKNYHATTVVSLQRLWQVAVSNGVMEAQRLVRRRNRFESCLLISRFKKYAFPRE